MSQKFATIGFEPRVARRVDAYWFLAFAVACTLALSGCNAIGSFDSKDRSETNRQAQEAAKARSAEIEAGNEANKPAMLRGDNSVAKGDYASAITFYRLAHDQNPNSIDPLLKLGTVAVKTGDYTLAYEAYHLVQVADPENPEAAFRLGELTLMRGSPQAALDQFVIAQAQRLDSPALYSAVGVAYSMMGKYKEAIQSYQDGLKIAPNHNGLRNNLGMAQFLAGDFDGSVKTLTELASAPNAPARYRRNLAFVYAAHGDDAKAKEVAGADIDMAALDNDVKAYRTAQTGNGSADKSGKAADRSLMAIQFIPSQAKPALAQASAAQAGTAQPSAGSVGMPQALAPAAAETR